MAIADTITSMQTHTSNAYTMIGYGTDLTGINKNLENLSSTIFEAFLEVLRTPDTLFTNLPKVSGTGANITLNDTANAPMRIELGASELIQDVTPTPDSPQDIHTISGDNTIKVCNKNLFEYESASDTNNTYVTQYRVFEIKNLKPNTQYNINNIGFTSNLNNQYCYLWSTDTYSTATKYALAGPSAYYNKIDFTSNNEGKMYLAIYPTDTTTWNSLIPYLKNAQIELGNITTSYEPHQEQSLPLNLGDLEYSAIGNYKDEFILTSGKNLLDLTDLTYIKSINTTGTWSNNAYTINGITYTFNEGGTIKANGTSTGNAGLSLYGTSTNQKTINGKYILLGATINNMTMRILNYTGSYNYLGTNNSATTPTELDLSTYKTGYIEIMVYSGNTINNVLITPMLTDTSITTFEPYGSNEWYIKKNIGKVVLNGSENWLTHVSNDWGSICYLNYPGVLKNVSILSNYFTYDKGLPDTTSSSAIGKISNNKYADNYLYIGSISANNTGLKTWLSTHNTEVYYVLDTPTYTQITGTLAEQLENIYQYLLSYKGQTNISQENDDLPFDMVATALKDLSSL